MTLTLQSIQDAIDLITFASEQAASDPSVEANARNLSVYCANYIAATSFAILAEQTRFAKWAHANADRAARQNIKVGYRVQLGSKRTGISAHKRSDCRRDFAFFGRCVQDWSIAEATRICGYRSLIGMPVTIKVKP